MASDASLLTSFTDDPALILLKHLVSGFNIFEAIGATNNELRHSSLLAFLLDPQQSHGLGDGFPRAFLKAVSRTIELEEHAWAATRLERLNTNDLLVSREFSDIDILLSSRSSRIVIVVENKIRSREHSNQLERYMQIASKVFPDHDRIGLYLTPYGVPPSSAAYVAVDYGLVANTVESFIAPESSTSDPSLQVLLTHYVRMLRRHVVGDSEVAQLCRDIYRKHRQALDLIYEHRPRFTQTLIDFLKVDPAVVFKASPKRGGHIQFTVPEWDLEELYTPSWIPSKRVLLFQFNNNTDTTGRLELCLLVGSGDSELRTKLIARAASNRAPFHITGESGAFTQLYEREFMTADEVAGHDVSGLEELFERRWSAFVESELPLLVSGMDIRSTLGLEDGS